MNLIWRFGIWSLVCVGEELRGVASYDVVRSVEEQLAGDRWRHQNCADAMVNANKLMLWIDTIKPTFRTNVNNFDLISTTQQLENIHQLSFLKYTQA